MIFLIWLINLKFLTIEKYLSFLGPKFNISALFFKSLKGIKQSDSILIMIMGTILAGPLIALVTDFYFILPYRFIPFIVAVAIGIGVFLSKEN